MAETAVVSPAVEAHEEIVGHRVPSRLYALKDGDTFVVADAFGDILGDGDGFFHNDTRLLSRLRLFLGTEPPSLLSAAVSRDNVFFTSNLTNRPLPALGGASTAQGVLHFERARFLWHDRLYERITCTNFGDQDLEIPLTIRFAADFSDMFEVRGTVRRARGRILGADVGEVGVTFRYEGLDQIVRATSIVFSERPRVLRSDRAEFCIPLKPNSKTQLYFEVGGGPSQPSRARFRHAAAKARVAMRRRILRGARLRSSGRLFNEWMDKSRADLALLTTDLPSGPYPYAGIPWFSTTFGRDAIITALQTLWLDTALARGVLMFLAETQAKETSAFQDAEPGKIIHETRKGEMTNLREVPFERYYGGVDATPLFVMLAGAYAARTGDLELIDRLWPALTAATAWMENVADADPGGFLTYARQRKSGLQNQAWKDSEDSIFHRDGAIPRGPIAVVEVQGYFYAALMAMAELAHRRGDFERSVRWHRRGHVVRTAVEKQFWREDLDFYGIALDGSGDLCAVRASNPGHLLFCGLTDQRRAATITHQLLSAAFDTGWGLRTLAPQQPRFNPMSYHNGSVWPHDTAICAAGMARYGERGGVVRLFNEMFETAVSFGMRMPELFCGFPRAAGEPPVAYPVACLPQAWSAGACFMMLQSCLGLHIDGWKSEVHIEHPHLPMGIDHLQIRRLAVGRHEVDLTFQRLDDRVVAFADAKGGARVPVLVRS